MKDYPYYYKRMKERKYNEATYDTSKLFEEVETILVKKLNLHPDDFKGNVNCQTFRWNDGDNDFEVNVHLYWIFYEEDVSKAKFKYFVRDLIRDEIRERYKELMIGYGSDVDCFRYDDSEYTSDKNAYDVELHFRLTYKLKEEN